jgi:type II secretory ATPase GspE/PulE/Tfp pilus assembly ATPase PilB-like protein
MDPFNFADALLGVLAQRLAKRLCRSCRKARLAKDEEIRVILEEYCEDMRQTDRFRGDPEGARHDILAYWRQYHGDDKGRITLYDAVGCDKCTNGYKGRIGLHELMLGTVAIKRLIQERAKVNDLFIAALGEGLRTLRQDGIKKVLEGITDMAQVRKVCIR